MSNNTQTVIPPSTLGEGKDYKWLKGKSPKSVELAEMPQQILDALVDEKAEDYGIKSDSDSGRIYLNFNIFIRKILKKIYIRMTKNLTFFVYERGTYKLYEEIDIVRLCQKYFEKFFPDNWSNSYDDQVIRTLRREVKYIKLRNNKKYINFANGLFNLEKFKLERHSPRKIVFNQIPHRYNKDAKCPLFLKFLNDIFDGDQKLIQLIFEIIGYLMTDSTLAQKAFIFWGVGRNGKSVLIKVIQELLGEDNYATLSLSKLAGNFSKVALINKKANISSENEVKNALDTENFKSITSGDKITSDVKFKEFISFEPYSKLVFSMNNLPFTQDKSYAFVRRLLIVPFNKLISTDEEIKGIEETLYPEIEGIIAKSIEALKELITNDYTFTACNAVDDVMEEYIESSSQYISFIKECMEYCEGSKATNYELKEAFKIWVENKGYNKNSLNIDLQLPNKLIKAFTSLRWSVSKGKSGNHRHITNIKLKKIESKEGRKNLSEDDI